MLLVEKQSDAEFLNNGFYSPDKTLAQCEWGKKDLEPVNIFLYLFISDQPAT